MQVRLKTTISTIIEVETPGVTFEEAKKEIFERYTEKLDGDNYEVEDIQTSQANSVCFDTVIASEVTHSFEEVK